MNPGLKTLKTDGSVIFSKSDRTCPICYFNLNSTDLAVFLTGGLSKSNFWIGSQVWSQSLFGRFPFIAYTKEINNT